MPRYGLARAALIAALVVTIGVLVAPYARYFFFSATTPRPVQARGDFADLERITIALFERASPSVVQVVALRDDRPAPGEFDPDSASGIGSGTGFLWDEAGNIVTNAHVVSGARQVAVRTASGQYDGGRDRRRRFHP